MEEIIYRSMLEADAQAIQKLNATSLGYDLSLSETKAQVHKVLQNPRYKVIIAQCEGRVIGYIHAESYECLYAKSLKNILSLTVDNDYKRRGIGRKLLLLIEEWAKEEGASGVCLDSRVERSEAHIFYQTCGYQKTKIQQKFKKEFKVQK